MPFDAVFNANDFTPRQGGGAHPVGNKFPFVITETEVKPTKDNTGGIFVVEFTSPTGSIKHNYNLWNTNDTSRRIANEQLSALCHAVGIFQVDFKNDGAALRNAAGLMDIGFQKGHEPSAEKPEGGYVELKKVYDKNGNEPGKAPAQQSQQNAGFGQQVTAQPAQQNAGFGQQVATNPNAGWGGQQAAANPAPEANQQAAGWGGGNVPANPPWGSK